MPEPNGEGLPPQEAPPQEPQSEEEPQSQEPQESVESEESPQMSEEDKILHKLKSWQGRREKELVEEIARMNQEHYAKIEGMISGQSISPQYQPVPQPQGPTLPPPPDPYSDNYAEEFDRYLEARDAQRAMENTTRMNQMEQQYRQSLSSPEIRHPDEQVHQAVLKEISDVQNVDNMTGSLLGPYADARINYAAALQKVIMKQYQPAKKNPLEKNTPPGPGFGVSSPSEPSPSPSTSMPKNLDDVTRKYADRLTSEAGWGADKVKKVLSE